jgi:uncharacterized protein YkwD
MNARIVILAIAGAIPALAATNYTGDGILSGRLEQQRWLINRARFAPEREADRLGLTNNLPAGHPYYDVAEDNLGDNAFGVTTNEWARWTVALPPLAPNASLATAASRHSRDMAENYVSHYSHYSPSSNYYPLGSSPAQRAALEGYTNTIIGFYENIVNGATGYSELPYPEEGYSSTYAHEALFVDTGVDNRGHRQAILNNSALEIGLGSFRTNYFEGLYYWTRDFTTQDFGTASTNHFFTETIFHDANTNGVYDETEGIAGIEVRLWDGTNQAAWYDISTASGNFAVPINDLTDGRTIRVELTNTNPVSRSITFPLGYTTLAECTLTNHETMVAGYYAQPAGITNVGFRDLVVAAQCTALTVGVTNAIVHFTSFGRIQYRLEANTDLTTTNWIEAATGTSTERTSQLTTPVPTNTRTFYRIMLLRD